MNDPNRRGHMASHIGRRKFLATLGGAAAAWPLAARAQQLGKLPTIGLLGATTPLVESQRLRAFVQRLHELGWFEGRSIAIEDRWAEGRTEKETAILRYLYRAGQRPVSRETLLQEVWGYNSAVTTHTLETHIYRLRQKIEKDAANPAILVTEAGGYKLVPYLQSSLPTLWPQRDCETRVDRAPDCGLRYCTRF